MNITPDMTGASYERMSQDIRQTGDGIERQGEANRALAAQDGVRIVEEFHDDAISAYDEKKVRPDFEKVLQAIERHDFDILYLWHTDRLYRQMADTVRLLQACRKGGVILRQVKGSTINPSQAGDEMVAYILAAVSQGESRHHAERRILANRQRAEKGKWYTANRAFGYGNGPSREEGDGKVGISGEPYEPEAQAIRDAAVDILAGKSIRAIARQWNAAGLTTTKGNKWTASQIRQTIVKPRYAAILIHRGEVFEGEWPPLIERQTYHALVKFVTDPSRSNGRTSWEQLYLGSGLYYCAACADEGMTTRMASNGSQPQAYVCRVKKHVQVAGESMDKYVIATILEWFARENCQELIHSPENVQKLLEEQLVIDGQIKELEQDAKAGINISVSVLLARNEFLITERRKIEAKLAAATGLESSPAARLVRESRRARRAKEDARVAVGAMWQSMTITQRAAAIDEVATVSVGPAKTFGPFRRSDDTALTRCAERTAVVPRQAGFAA